jgi:hypothetical protein
VERFTAPHRRIDMDWPFLGTEALATGAVTRYRLATHYDAVFRYVYVPKGQALTPVDKAVAAWLWIDAKLPAELNQPSQH